MNDEIKEILEALKPHNDIIKEYPLTLSIEEQKLLLDYIIDLQVENDITESYEETCKEQDEEIEKLKEEKKKAIEFIKENAGYDEEISSCCDDLLYSDCDKLIELLGGDE